ncbi:hypothetical protein GQ53DRAFT_765913 [Thozetella sp. PMI_491]|nr:hypothetical protein GQ53DRAFT_765913 [Thozetella sp. PMI_491]
MFIFCTKALKLAFTSFIDLLVKEASKKEPLLFQLLGSFTYFYYFFSTYSFSYNFTSSGKTSSIKLPLTISITLYNIVILNNLIEFLYFLGWKINYIIRALTN